MVLWDDIAVNEDKSNDPRYNRTKSESATLWSDSKIANPEVTRNPEYSLASATHQGNSLTLGESRCKRDTRITYSSMKEGGHRRHANTHTDAE